MDEGSLPSNGRHQTNNNTTTAHRVQKLLAHSTIHGLSRLHHSQTNQRRTIWCLTILIVLALVGAHLSILISDFLANETDVDVKRAETRTLDFPAVTICNANPVKKSALIELAPRNQQLRKLLDLEVYGRTEPGIPLNTWTSYMSERTEYYLSTATASYQQATASCQRMDAKLVNIDSASLALDFRHAIGTDFYVELDDDHREHSSLWDRWRYGGWYHAEYRIRRPGKCLLVSVHGVYASDCQTPSGYICQRSGSSEGREAIDFRKAETVTRMLASLTEKDRRQVGHQLSSLVFYCRFNGRRCNASAVFQPFTNPYLGNCYTFNADVTTIKAVRLLAPVSGRRHGLELGINIEQDEVLRAAGSQPGAVLLVHSKYSTPFPEDGGTVMTAGLYNTISMRVVQINRLPEPYGQCLTDDMDATDMDAYTSQYQFTYSKVGCMKTCYQRYMIEICRCALPDYPISGKPFVGRNFTFCDVNDHKQQVCRKRVDRAFAENRFDCSCPDACHEDVYVSFKSAARWPMLNKMDATIASLKKIFPDQFNKVPGGSSPETDRQVLTNNFLKAAIYYEDMHHEIISETPAYTVFQFVGDVGGMLALWIGVSALGVVQIVEFLILEIFIKAKNVFNSRIRDTDSNKAVL